MPDKIAALQAEVAALRATVQRLEAERAPMVPAPPAPPKPIPGMAPQGDFGVNYSGAPTGNVTAASGTVGVKPDAAGRWRDPSGIVRNELGDIVPIAPGPLPRLVERDWQHEMSVRILDHIVATTPPRKE